VKKMAKPRSLPTVAGQKTQPGKDWFKNYFQYLSTGVGNAEYYPDAYDISRIPQYEEDLRYYRPGFRKAGLGDEITKLSARIKKLKIKYHK